MFCSRSEELLRGKISQGWRGSCVTSELFGDRSLAWWLSPPGSLIGGGWRALDGDSASHGVLWSGGPLAGS